MKRILLLIGVVILAARCGNSELPAPLPTPVPAPEPTMIPAPVPPTPEPTVAVKPCRGDGLSWEGDCQESKTCVHNKDGFFYGKSCKGR